MNIYQELILDHYKHPKNYGELAGATCTATANNPLCGDKFVLQAVLEKELIVDLKFSGEGCAISTASASMLTEYAKGKKKNEILTLNKEFILEMLGIELSPNRLKCALLPLEGLHMLLLQ